MIGQRHDQLASGSDLDRAGRHGNTDDFMSLHPETWCRQPHAHSIELRAYAARDGRQPLESATVKGIAVRAADDPDFPGAADREPMAGRPARRQRLPMDQRSLGQAIARGDRPTEAATKSPALTERPAAENDRDIDAASHGNIGS